MHKFKIEHLPKDTIMTCQCGLTYHWDRGAWCEVLFRNTGGFIVDLPSGDCGTGLVESEEEEEEEDA